MCSGVQTPADAGKASQISDDYVLTVVAFALVLFFAGVSSKLATRASQYLAIGLGATLRWRNRGPIHPPQDQSLLTFFDEMVG